MENNNSIEIFFNKVQDLIKGKVVEDKGAIGDNRTVDPNKAEDYNTDLMSQEPNVQKTIKKIVGEEFKTDPSDKGAQTAADKIITKFGKHPIVNNDQKIPNLNQGIQDTPNGLSGDRGMNTMERKIMNFNQFLNENNYNQFLNEKNR